ncbi:MAG: hypothetical protein ACU0DI_17305 [Paracoccaceae bacterium]
MTVLFFNETPATRLDPKLADLSEIDDAAKRTRQTLTYFREVVDNWPPVPAPPPERDSVPKVVLVDGRLDIAPSTPSPDEQSDPVKLTALERLRDAGAVLLRCGNKHLDIDTVARRLSANIGRDFADIDILSVHFDLEACRDIYDHRAERSGDDILAPDTVSALSQVAQVGPGLTLDNADVEKLEERRRRYDGPPIDESLIENHDTLSKSISKNTEAFGQAIRDLSDIVQAGSTAELDRRRTGQFGLNRDTVFVAGGLVAAGFFGETGSAIYEWFVTSASAISALAPGWGEAFQAWITPILMRAREASEAAKSIAAKRR